MTQCKYCLWIFPDLSDSDRHNIFQFGCDECIVAIKNGFKDKYEAMRYCDQMEKILREKQPILRESMDKIIGRYNSGNSR